MTLLKNLDTNTEITRYVSLDTSQKQISVIQQTLDGITHIQRIGSPAVSYAVTAYVDWAGKTLLLSAEHTAALLQADVCHGTYYGRITELKFGDRLACDWYKADITLSREGVT